MDTFNCFKKAFQISESENGIGNNVVWGIHQNKHLVFFEIAIPLRCDGEYMINGTMFFQHLVKDHGYQCDTEVIAERGTCYLLLKGGSEFIQYESIGTSRLFPTSRVSNYTLEEHNEHMKRLINEVDHYADYAVFFGLSAAKAPQISLFCTKNMKRGSWVMRGDVLAFHTKKDGMYFKLKMP